MKSNDNEQNIPIRGDLVTYNSVQLEQGVETLRKRPHAKRSSRQYLLDNSSTNTSHQNETVNSLQSNDTLINIDSQINQLADTSCIHYRVEAMNFIALLVFMVLGLFLIGNKTERGHFMYPVSAKQKFLPQREQNEAEVEQNNRKEFETIKYTISNDEITR